MESDALIDLCHDSAFDSRNLQHLACTEVRAANLIHCKMEGDEELFWNRDQCVKETAAKSVAVIHKVSRTEALSLVDKVFVKCSKDLEPIGRIVFNRDCQRAALSDYHLYHRYRRES